MARTIFAGQVSRWWEFYRTTSSNNTPSLHVCCGTCLFLIFTSRAVSRDRQRFYPFYIFYRMSHDILIINRFLNAYSNSCTVIVMVIDIFTINIFIRKRNTCFRNYLIVKSVCHLRKNVMLIKSKKSKKKKMFLTKIKLKKWNAWILNCTWNILMHWYRVKFKLSNHWMALYFMSNDNNIMPFGTHKLCIGLKPRFWNE